MKRTALTRKTPLRAKTPLKQKRAKPRRKVKRDTVPSLRRKLDRVFSEYIRRRDANHSLSGAAKCCSCYRPFHWTIMDAGHYIKRGKAATRYDERNVHAQCHWCNRFQDGAMPGYTLFLIRRYGPDIIETLYEKSTQEHKWRVTELRAQVAEYKAKLTELDAAT